MAPQRTPREWNYLDPQVCRYCRRVFYNKQSRYLRHLRHHELSIRPYWYKPLRRPKTKGVKCKKGLKNKTVATINRQDNAMKHSQSDTFQKEPVIRPVIIQFSKRDKVKADLALSLMLSKVSHLGTNKVGHVTTSRLSKSPSRNKVQIGFVSDKVPIVHAKAAVPRKLTKCDKVPMEHAKVAAARKTTKCDKVLTGHAKAIAPRRLTKFDKVPKKSTKCDNVPIGRAKTATPRKLSNGEKKQRSGQVSWSVSSKSKRIGRVVPPSINTNIASNYDELHHGNESSSVSSASTNRQNVQTRHVLPTSRSIESTYLDRVHTGLLSATVRKSPSVRSCDKTVQIGLVSPLITNKNLHYEEVNVGHNISISSLTESTHNVLSSQAEGAQKEHVAASVTSKSTHCDKVQTARVSPSIRGKSKHCDKKVQDGSPSRESKSSHCGKVQPKHVTFFEDLWGDKLPTSIVTEASKKKATNSNKTIQVAHVSPSLKSTSSSCEKGQVSHVTSPVSNHSTHGKKVESEHVSSSLQYKATNRDDGLQKGCVPRSVTNKPANKSSDCDKFQVGQTATRKLKTAHGIKAAALRMVTSSDKKSKERSSSVSSKSKRRDKMQAGHASSSLSNKTTQVVRVHEGHVKTTMKNSNDRDKVQSGLVTSGATTKTSISDTKSRIRHNVLSSVTSKLSHRDKVQTGLQDTAKKSYICQYCNKAFRNVDIKRHHEQMHVNEQSSSNLTSQEQTRKNEKPYKCKYCNKCFKQSDYKKIHEQTHSNERPYKSQYCNKGFKTSTNVLKHERTHSNEKPYKCQYCNKAFKYPANVKIHERIHTNEKPYKCQVCYKSFICPSDLKLHDRNHTNEKPYACQYCNKKFKHSGNCRVHERRHTNMKPYKCQHCTKDFYSSQELIMHTRTHTKEKPYKCQFCDKCFIGSGEVKVHERIHTKEKPYKCQYCGKCFIQASHVKAHERIHTREGNTTF